MKKSLSRLSFRWLPVVHLLMSARHLEVCVAIWVSEGGKERNCCERNKPWVVITEPRDLVYKENRTGPSTQPWGTPVSRVQGLDRKTFHVN